MPRQANGIIDLAERDLDRALVPMTLSEREAGAHRASDAHVERQNQDAGTCFARHLRGIVR